TQVPPDLHRQATGRLVPPCAILFQTLHHDPVQVATNDLSQPGRFQLPVRRNAWQIPLHRQKSCTGLWWFVFPDNFLDLGKCLRTRLLWTKWRRSGQQFVEKDTERVDVAPSVDVQV